MNKKIDPKLKKQKTRATGRKASAKYRKKNKNYYNNYAKNNYHNKIKPKKEAQKLIVKGLQILERLKKTR